MASSAFRSHTPAEAGHPHRRVRGAIDLVAVAGTLAGIRGLRNGDGYAAVVLDAACVALSARISLDDTSELRPEQVIRELWENHSP